MVFLTPASLNKPVNEFKLYFFIYFYFIFGLGPAQPMWAGLDPAAQPGHWPKPVTRLASTRKRA